MGALDAWIRAAAFAAGLLGLVAFFQSILRVALLNRRQRDWLATRIGNFIGVVFRRLARNQRDYGAIQKTMDWAFPIYNLSLIAVWFLLVQTSFALMIWALELDKSWLKAFIASGSALSTLGFATPSSSLGQLLGVLEGAVGLGIVVFIFTFIPGYRAAVQAREDMVGWLYARVSARPTAFGLIEWHQIADQGGAMMQVWSGGESWFRGLLETHSRTPLLVLVPSVYSGRTWIGAATFILDAASFVLSSLNTSGQESARLCHEAGVSALSHIARELPGAMDAKATTSETIEQLASAFDAAYEKFAAAGLLMKPNRDQCRRDFLTHRSRYGGLLRGIALAALMPIDEP